MFVSLEGILWSEITSPVIMNRFAVQLANAFMREDCYPVIRTILSSFHLITMDKLIKELCKVG